MGRYRTPTPCSQWLLPSYIICWVLSTLQVFPTAQLCIRTS